MQQLVFSHNWNKGKLDNKAFTTLRLSDRFKVGEQVEILLNDQVKGIARIEDKKSLLIYQITKGMAFLDTGYSPEETRNIIRKMYPNANFDRQKIYWYLLTYI